MEAAGGAPSNPPSVHDVFQDFKGRRTAIIKALTTDFEDFFRQCDPEKEDLCLYGFPNEVWQVDLPAEEVPAEIPEPVLGINFARDGMQERDWLSFVAAHSDTWLTSVAMFFGARFGFDKADRSRLFNMINDLPTVLEVVVGKVKRQGKKKSSASNHDNNKSKSNSKRGFESQRNYSKQWNQRTRMIWKRTTKKNMERHFVEHVERMMRLMLMDSGFAATFVKGGFMGNV